MRWRTLGLLAIATVTLNVVALVLEPSLLRLARYDIQPSVAPIMVYRDAPRADILFMGNSRALFGFDPSQAELELAQSTTASVEALNVAIPGGDVYLQYLFLKNVIDERKKPLVIVYGLSEFELASSGTNRATRIPYFSLLLRPDDFARFGGERPDEKLEFVVDEVCPACRDRELIRKGLGVLLDPDDPLHQLYTTGRRAPTQNGYASWPPELRITPLGLDRDRELFRVALHNFEIDSERLQMLRDFLRLANARGIRVVLVNLPVTPEYVALWDSEKLNRYLEVVRWLSTDNGIPLVDAYLAAGTSIPKDAFVDLHHMNDSGAAALTRMVARPYLSRELARVNDESSARAGAPGVK